MRFQIGLLAFLLGAGCAMAGIALARGDSFGLLGPSPLPAAGVSALLGLLALLPAYAATRLSRQPLRQLRQDVDALPERAAGTRLRGGNSPEMRRLAGSITEFARRMDRRNAELELDEIRLRMILEGMVEGVVALDPRQYVAFANSSAGRMLEFDPAAAVGRPFYELTRFPKIQAAVEKGLSSGQPYREEVEWPAGPVKHLAVHVARLNRERASGAIIVLNDTTELRRLEQLRRDFVANVSHELKTPLAVITACVESLLDGAVDDPEVRTPFLRQIAESGERLHALILDLISLARIESGKDMFDLMAVPLAETAEYCTLRHRPRADNRGIAISVEEPAGAAISVWVDPEAIEHILDNLIDNAVKYTPDGGSIRISCAAQGKMARLAIADTGPGIPAADLTRVFERFFRVDRARSRELGGTGLGLSIVKHLVNSMGGIVSAESELGRGTTITVALPLANVP